MPKRHLLAFAFFAVALLSVWFRAGYLTQGLWGALDDALFVRIARNIASGEWLGGYDSAVLTKGAFFPFFIALNKLAGLPLKATEHLLYLGVSYFAATSVSRLTGQRWLALALFSILAFSLMAWGAMSARVLREPLYQILSLALFFLTAQFFLLKPERGYRFGMVLGVVGGCYWLTREEGVWLFPSLLVLALPAAWRILTDLRNGQYGSLKEMAKRVIVPLSAFLAIVLLVNLLNWMKYGVFRNNDFRSGPFVEAYGALARIKHDQWQRYVIFPRDARERAYAVSSAARELAPYFEGDSGKRWAMASHDYPSPWGCIGAPRSCNSEILSGWFIWALRDAVEAAGYSHQATDADAYYRQLADEINTACESNAIPCRDRRATLAPVWRGHYLRDTLIASRDVLATLVSLGQGQVGVPASALTPDQAHIFQATVGGQLNGIADDGTTAIPEAPDRLDKIRSNITQRIAYLYATLSPWLAVSSLIGYIVMLFACCKIKSASISGNSIVVLTALLVALSCRVGLLGFLEATSIPSNNLIYLLPAVPLYLLFVVASTGLAIVAFTNYMCGGRTIS